MKDVHVTGRMGIKKSLGWDLCPWEGSKEEVCMGRPTPWGVSRSSHNLGIPVLGSCAEKTKPLACREKPLGQTEGIEKPSLYL